MILSSFEKPLALQLDLSILGNAGVLVNRTIAKFGKIDISVNNAGIFNLAPVQCSDFSKIYGDIKTINQDAPVELSRLAAPHIKKSSGAVVFIGSIAAGNPVGIFFSHLISSNFIRIYTRSGCDFRCL